MPAKESQVQALDAQGTANATNAAVTYRSLSISIQVQQKSEWCVPASTRAILTHFSQSPTQTTLATKLHTSNTNGTAMSAIAPVLNSYESSNTYAIAHPSSSTDLINRVTVDYLYNSPVEAGIKVTRCRFGRPTTTTVTTRSCCTAMAATTPRLSTSIRWTLTRCMGNTLHRRRPSTPG
jgi:hypothetical protein